MKGKKAHDCIIFKILKMEKVFWPDIHCHTSLNHHIYLLHKHVDGLTSIEEATGQLCDGVSFHILQFTNASDFMQRIHAEVNSVPCKMHMLHNG